MVKQKTRDYEALVAGMRHRPTIFDMDEEMKKDSTQSLWTTDGCKCGIVLRYRASEALKRTRVS